MIASRRNGAVHVKDERFDPLARACPVIAEMIDATWPPEPHIGKRR